MAIRVYRNDYTGTNTILVSSGSDVNADKFVSTCKYSELKEIVKAGNTAGIQVTDGVLDYTKASLINELAKDGLL